MLTSELKFIVTNEIADSFLDWARLELPADPHAAPGGDSYQTTTLYFDTDDFDLFFRRGSNGRAKFRIRAYNSGQTVFLERKMKTGGRRSKRRSEVPRAGLEQITRDGDWAGRWFARRLKHRRLHPVCQIAYTRTARAGTITNTPLRVTVDRDVSAVQVERIEFTDNPATPILPGQA